MLLLPLQAIAIAGEARNVAERRADAQADAQVIARTSATLVDRFARDLESTVQAVTLIFGLSALPLDQPSRGPFLAALLEQFVPLRSVFLTDLQGRVIAGPRPDSLGLDLSDRPYIQALRQGKDAVWTGHLSGVQTGDVIVAHARVVRGPDGQPRAYMAAAFYPDRLIGLLALNLPGDADLVLIDQSGLVLYSSAPQSLSNVSESYGVRAALSGAVVPFQGVATPFQGEPSFGALVPVSSTGWVIAYSRSQSTLEASLRQRLLVESAAITLGACPPRGGGCADAGGTLRPG